MPEEAEVDTANQQLVGMFRNQVVVALPRVTMTPEEAYVHAAWLVVMANIITEDESRFEVVRKAVEGT